MTPVFLSSLEFDTLGYVMLAASGASELSTVSRRMTRVATLDGGIAVNDFGFSHADRTFRIEARVSEKAQRALRYMCESYGRLRCAIPDGVFLVAFESMKMPESDRVALSLLVLRKEA